ncbi:MAG: glycosyltransferase [Pseudomonadota bacterium]
MTSLRGPSTRSLLQAFPAAIVRHLPRTQRAKHFQARLEAGRYDLLPAIASAGNPFTDGDPLFRAVDYLLLTGAMQDLPDLAALARISDVFAAKIWKGVCLWHEGHDEQARAEFERIFDDHSHSGFARRAARAWAMYLSLPRFQPAGPGAPPPLMQFWDTVPPADVAAEMRTWEALGDSAYTRFDAAEAVRFFARNIGGVEADLLAACPHPAVQSDYFRLGWLMVHGGVYVDADARMRGGFAALYPRLGDKTLLWFRTRAAEMTVINGFIAAPPDAPFVQHAFKLACRRLASDETRHVFDYAGPTLLTQAALRLFERDRLGDVASLSDGFIAARIMGQFDASYKRDTRNWRRWMAERGS